MSEEPKKPATITPIRGRDLIAALEDWLNMARKGEVRAIAFCAVDSYGRLHEGWVGETDTDLETVSLYGAINVLRDAYFHEFIEHFSTADIGDSSRGPA